MGLSFPVAYDLSIEQMQTLWPCKGGVRYIRHLHLTFIVNHINARFGEGFIGFLWRTGMGYVKPQGLHLLDRQTISHRKTETYTADMGTGLGFIRDPENDYPSRGKAISGCGFALIHS